MNWTRFYSKRELTFELNVPSPLQDWFKSPPPGGKISIIRKDQEANVCKTVIDSEAFLIEIELEEDDVYRVLWGVIAFDETGRWRPGNYVCTTPIQKTEDLGEGIARFLTRSGRIYETTCPVQPYKAKSLSELQFFMTGFSPDELGMMEELRKKKYEILSPH